MKVHYMLICAVVLAFVLTTCVNAPSEIETNVGIPKELSLSANTFFGGSYVNASVESNCPALKVVSSSASGTSVTASLLLTEYPPPLENCLSLRHSDGVEAIKTRIVPKRSISLDDVFIPALINIDQDVTVKFTVRAIDDSVAQSYVIKATTPSSDIFLDGKTLSEFTLRREIAQSSPLSAPTSTLKIGDNGDSRRQATIEFQLFLEKDGVQYGMGSIKKDVEAKKLTTTT